MIWEVIGSLDDAAQRRVDAGRRSPTARQQQVVEVRAVDVVAEDRRARRVVDVEIGDLVAISEDVVDWGAPPPMCDSLQHILRGGDDRRGSAARGATQLPVEGSTARLWRSAAKTHAGEVLAFLAVPAPQK